VAASFAEFSSGPVWSRQHTGDTESGQRVPVFQDLIEKAQLMTL
jgi:hypothetical protein